jgi:hypothetical protein
MYKCQICQREYRNKSVLYKHVAIRYGWKQEPIHCSALEYRCKYDGENQFSKDNLEKMYITDGKSTPMMSDELKVHKYALLKTMHDYGIKLRNTSEASKNRAARDGVWNRGLTKKDHPGIMAYAKKRLGKNNPYYTAPNFEERQKKQLLNLKKAWKTFNNNRNPASTEKRMAEILDQEGLHYIRNFSLSFYKNGKTKWRLYDFLVEGKLLIEMQGNYFHANPRMYDKDYMVVIARTKRKAEDIWKYDEHKRQLGIDNGYDVSIIWEDEFVKMNDSKVIKNILKFIN